VTTDPSSFPTGTAAIRVFAVFAVDGTNTPAAPQPGCRRIVIAPRIVNPPCDDDDDDDCDDDEQHRDDACVPDIRRPGTAADTVVIDIFRPSVNV
jgi:hypothetical protein